MRSPWISRCRVTVHSSIYDFIWIIDVGYFACWHFVKGVRHPKNHENQTKINEKPKHTIVFLSRTGFEHLRDVCLVVLPQASLRHGQEQRHLPNLPTCHRHPSTTSIQELNAEILIQISPGLPLVVALAPFVRPPGWCQSLEVHKDFSRQASSAGFVTGRTSEKNFYEEYMGMQQKPASSKNIYQIVFVS